MLENVDLGGKPKRSLLPVLVVLFVVSYGLMTLLVVEQARTIESQRSMLSLMLDDSIQLMKMKGQEVQRKKREAAEAEAHSQSKPQVPTIQAAPQENIKRPSLTDKQQTAVPQRLPKRSEDTPNVRRLPVTL